MLGYLPTPENAKDLLPFMQASDMDKMQRFQNKLLLCDQKEPINNFVLENPCIDTYGSVKGSSEKTLPAINNSREDAIGLDLHQGCFPHRKNTFPTLTLVHLGVSYDFLTRKWRNDHHGNPLDQTLWGQNPDDYPIQPQMDDIIG